MLDSFAPPRRSLVSRLVDSLDRERTTIFLLICSVLVSATYLATIFEPEYILGHGPFWDNPRGPWLMDSADIDESADILDAQIGYLGFLATPWHVPVFLRAQSRGAVRHQHHIPRFRPGRGACWASLPAVWPAISSIRTEFWVAACFVLSAVFAVLLVIELGQRSLLAAAAASVLALSAPTLLHRFGHLALMGHFVVIGALLLYFVDRRAALSWKLTARWAGWLVWPFWSICICSSWPAAIYFASVLRREALTPGRVGPFVRERLTIVGVLVLVTVLAGHFGKGTGNGITTGSGFGIFSMNLASPFWPQRSGLFPGHGGDRRRHRGPVRRLQLFRRRRPAAHRRGCAAQSPPAARPYHRAPASLPGAGGSCRLRRVAPGVSRRHQAAGSRFQFAPRRRRRDVPLVRADVLAGFVCGDASWSGPGAPAASGRPQGRRSSPAAAFCNSPIPNRCATAWPC